MYPDSPGLKLERRANIVWDSGGPKTVLLVKKPNNVAAAQKLAEMGYWCAGAPFVPSASWAQTIFLPGGFTASNALGIAVSENQERCLHAACARRMVRMAPL